MTDMSEYANPRILPNSTPSSVGKGSLVGSVIMNATASRPVSDSAIQVYLGEQIHAGNIPKPSDVSVYMMYLAPDILSQLCIDAPAYAYHSAFELPTGRYLNVGGIEIVTPVTYAVMPSPTQAVVGSESWKQNITIYSSHELSEAVTNPNNRPGPLPPNYTTYKGFIDPVQQQEIADVCWGPNTTVGLYHGYWIQGVWSNNAYARTGDGRVLPPGTTFPHRIGRPDGILPGAGGSGIALATEDDVDPVEPLRPVPVVPATAIVSIDTPLELPDLTAGATNPCGISLYAAAETLPAHGRLGSTHDGSGRMTYIPDSGYTGPDSFTYRLTDGGVESVVATAAVQVMGPVALPGDLTEGNAAAWAARADGGTASLADDPTRAVAGQTSLKLTTDGPSDVAASYTVAAGRTADVSHARILHLALQAVNPNDNGFQNGSPWVRLIDASGSYLQYQYYSAGQPLDVLNRAVGGWQSFDIPLDASDTATEGWRRTAFSSPDLTQLRTLELHADTWGYSGFTLWADDLGFRGYRPAGDESPVAPVNAPPDPYGPGTSADQNTAFVKGLYRTVLGRDADAGGIASWTAALAAGLSPLDATRGFWNSPENRAVQVDGYYRTFLGREPDAAGRQGWIDALVSGAVDEIGVASLFLQSPEAIARGATTGGYVDLLYSSVLGRPADAAGRADWVQKLDGGTITRPQLVAGLVRSAESYDRILSSFYRAYLKRTPSAAELADWRAVIGGLRVPLGDVAVGFVGSAEFYANAAGAVG